MYLEDNNLSKKDKKDLLHKATIRGIKLHL